MKYDAESACLSFASPAEAREFHNQISALVRSAMMEATRSVEDPERATEISRCLLREHRAVVRALNAMRKSLPRKQFG